MLIMNISAKLILNKIDKKSRMRFEYPQITHNY
jgi:hypothetical protein